jgi:multiple sugar transport system permease protein
MNLNQPWKGRPFIGLKNYKNFFTDSNFYYSLWLTLYWTVGTIIGKMALGFGVALLLNQHFRGRTLVRAIVLIPWAIPSAMAAIMFSTMFNAQGVISQVLINLNLTNEYVRWLASTTLAMPVLIVTHVWKNFPFPAIMILAGLQAIPGELYEAAAVDGANAFDRFFKITLPLLRPVMVVTFLLNTILSLKSIDLHYIMTFGGPANSTKVLAFYAYHKAFTELRFGKGAALGAIVTLITVMISIFYLRKRGWEQ